VNTQITTSEAAPDAMARIWALDSTVFAVRLTGALDAERLRSAVADALWVTLSDAASPQLTDLSHLGGHRESALERAACELASHRFAPDSEVSTLASIYRLAPDEHALVVVASPAVGCATAWPPFARTVAEAYSSGRPAVVSVAAKPYTEADAAYWAEQLHGAQRSVVLPVDHPSSIRRGQAGQVPVVLSDADLAGLRELGSAAGASPPEVLVAAYAALLMRYGAERDVLLRLLGGKEAGAAGPGQRLLRLRVSRADTFAQLVKTTRAAMAGAAHHGEMTPAQLCEVMQTALGGSDPAPSAWVSVAERATDQLRLPGIQVAELPDVLAPTGRAIELRIRTHTGGPSMSLMYSAEMFDAPTAERVAEQVRSLLTGATRHPELPVRRLPVLACGQAADVTIAGYGTEPANLGTAVLTDLLEEAWTEPAGIALVDDRGPLTYAALDARANRLGHQLRSVGVGPEIPVGVLVERGAQALVAFLGILKAGGVYLPLDPQYPPERLDYIAAHAGMRALVTCPGLDRLVTAASGVPVVSLERDGGLPGCGAEQPPARRIHPDNLAYLIYTSGSTGLPKGVGVSHRGAVNLALAQRQAFQLDSSDAVAQFASLGFDASVWEMVMALGAGARLVVVDPKGNSPQEIAQYMTVHGVTCATLPPAFLRTLTGTELPGIRVLVSAGEACTPDLDRAWSVDRKFFNAYGPTEASVCATMERCDGHGSAVALGCPLPNTQAHVLDDQLEPVPAGVAGEMHIGGAGLARGYQGEPARTAAAFVPDPYGPPGSRLYRTGDLVRHTADRQLLFVGRRDYQMKIRGYRVESGEVESVIARHTDVLDVVVLQVTNALQEPSLVACVVLTPDARSVAGRGTGQLRWQGRSLHRELHEFAGATLPDYMLPNRYVSLGALPLTVHGKVDREALARVASQTTAEETPAEAPVRAEGTPGATELAIAAIWAEHLGLEYVRGDDHFLEIGGHSLVAVQVIGDIRRKFSVAVPIRVLFDNPVLADFCAAVDDLTALA